MTDRQTKKRFWKQFIRGGLPLRLFLGLTLIAVGLWIGWTALFEEPEFVWRYMIVPIFMVVLGARQLYLAYREFFCEKTVTPEVEITGWAKANALFWKWATRIGMIFAFALGFWVVFFFAVFFVFFPYLFSNAMREMFEGVRKELLKTQQIDSLAGGERKVKFTLGEKLILGIGVTVFLIGESLWIINILSRDKQSGKELFTAFGILFSCFWLFGFTFILTFAGIGAFRGLKATIRKRIGHEYVQPRKTRPPVFKAVYIIAGVLIFLGFTSFMSGLVFDSFVIPGKPVVSGEWCFPIAEPEGIAVDNEHIVLRSTFYQRIQVYDKDGNFQNGWFCPKVKGAHLLIDGQGRIQLAGYENEWFFDIEGNLLSKVSKEYDFDRFQDKFGKYDDWVTQDDQYNTYHIPHPHMWPSVIKHCTDGAEMVLISWPCYLWFLNGPFLSWLTAAAGMLLAVALATFEKSMQLRSSIKKLEPVRIEQARLSGQ